MATPDFDQQVSAIRRFNRFYTRKIGVLDGMASRPFALAEARVLYEVAHRERPTATDVRKELGLDAGYLSRILRGFERQHLVKREASKADERQRILSLTPKGRKAFALLNDRSNADVAGMLEGLSPAQRKQLVEAVQTIVRLLGDDEKERRAPYLLRQHHPGDLAWIVERQTVLYVEEYGWDGSYEGLAAEIVARFIKQYDARRERCWIAERDGHRVGAVLVANASDDTAQLRLLHVEAEARGLGIGRRLVDECVRFARQAGYHRMILWTQSILQAARHIYRQTGFEIVREEQHHSFGKDLTAETWALDLRKTTVRSTGPT